MSRQNISVGIIGLGLIGASLAKRLAQQGYDIIGIAYSDRTFLKADDLNIFRKVSKNICDLNGCDIIFVATPINKISLIFQNLNDVITQPCVITDVASIKSEISEYACKIFDSDLITFIPGHPMAGTEKQGIDNAFPELFEGCNWVLCPINLQKTDYLNDLNTVIESTGAKIVYANPKQHDHAVALISHMPLLLSICLVDALDNIEDYPLKELALFLASSGYRDTTRLAAGNAELSHDMCKYNYKNLLNAFKSMEKSINKIKTLLEEPKDEVLEKFEHIASFRKALYSDKGKNIFRGLSQLDLS